VEQRPLRSGETSSGKRALVRSFLERGSRRIKKQSEGSGDVYKLRRGVGERMTERRARKRESFPHYHGEPQNYSQLQLPQREGRGLSLKETGRRTKAKKR